MHHRLRHATEAGWLAAVEDSHPRYDATYGEIHFGRDHGADESARFACVAMTAEAAQLERLAFDGWRLPRPSMILSIVGNDEADASGARTATGLAPTVEEACAEALGRIARHADAWIVSGGFDRGASAIVGLAVRSAAAEAAPAASSSSSSGGDGGVPPPHLNSALLAVAPLPLTKYHERFLPDDHEGADAASPFSPIDLRDWMLEPTADETALTLSLPGAPLQSAQTATVAQVVDVLGRAKAAATRELAAELRDEMAAASAASAASAPHGGAAPSHGVTTPRLLSHFGRDMEALKRAVCACANQRLRVQKSVRYVKRDGNATKTLGSALDRTRRHGAPDFDASGYALQAHHTHYVLVDAPDSVVGVGVTTDGVRAKLEAAAAGGGAGAREARDAREEARGGDPGKGNGGSAPPLRGAAAVAAALARGGSATAAARTAAARRRQGASTCRACSSASAAATGATRR